MNIDVQDKRVFASTGGVPFDNTKPCVILVHGSGLDHSFWDLHAQFFASRNFAVVCPDLPGHSNSEGPPMETIEALAAWLNNVIETLDVKNISIIGHSQGALVALEFVAQHPERIRSVSLVAGGLPIAVNPLLIGAAENEPEKAVEMMIRWGFAANGKSGKDPAAAQSILADMRAVTNRNASLALAADLRANDAYRNGTLAAGKIRRPVQVIIAGKDKMIPKQASDALVAHLDDPEVHVLPESSHMLLLEAPEECLDRLIQFISTNNPAA